MASSAAMLAGSADLVLDSGVRHLHPERAVFEAILEGWCVQQRSRYLREETIAPRVAVVRRLVAFSDLNPWQWTPQELEAFGADAASGPRGVVFSTMRGYQNAIRMFCEYVADARYGWNAQCTARFGAAPVQICHEWNTVAHVSEYEGSPGRRALTYDEVQSRYGKASSGGPPKRRTVLTVPEMDWVVESLTAWRDEVRPVFSPGRHPAVFVTERCGRLQVRHANDAFNRAASDAGLPSELDLHCLRHFVSA